MPIFDCHVYLEGNILPNVNQTATQLAQLIQARQIDRAIVLSARARHVDPITGNRILKTMLDQTPDLYGCLVTHMNRVDASVQMIKELLGNRKFMALLLANTRSQEPLHPLIADDVLNAARRYQKPIYLQTPNANCVDVALTLARTYSMHKFVFLGMGGADWRNAIAAAHQSVNIFLETSGALDRAKIPAAVEAIGSHRILYGSSLPNLDPAAALGLLSDARLSGTDMRRILYENASRLFNLDQVEA